VASTDEYLNAKSAPPKEKGQQKKQPSWPSKQTVSAIAAPRPDTASDEESSTQADEAGQEGVQAAAAAAVQKSKGKLNPHLSAEQVRQLIAKKVCLSCYKAGHFSGECRKPANRPPTEAESN
jgi:hypothetical protein